MRNFKLKIAYDGSDFVGWQIQPNGRSVQQVLEAAWLQVTQESARIIASGRTDAGVHALGQVCSVLSRTELPAEQLQRALNATTDEDVQVWSVEEVQRDFHPIRDALRKTYRYQLRCGGVPDVFRRRYCWFLPRRLDVAPMREAASLLCGTHDFAGFQSAGSERATTVRTILELKLQQRTDLLGDEIQITISADGFLYNMARNIVGSLVEVGQHKRTPQWVKEILSGRDRTLAGATAPAQGLFLVDVLYA